MRTGSTKTRKKNRTRMPSENTSGRNDSSILVLEADETPGGALAPGHLGLALPRQHGHPPQKRQAPGHLAARVDPHGAVDELDAVDAQSHQRGLVQREHREQLLAQAGLRQAGAA